jgi:hypothetical protein
VGTLSDEPQEAAMAISMIRMTETECVADQAMGLELMAIEVEERLEWAEAPGRTEDATALVAELRALLGQLADVAEVLSSAA